MCEQKKILKKIREKGKVNGFDVELAEAQMHDYISLKKDVDSVKADVQAIKTEQAIQGGKLDLIIQRLNSPVEQDRIQGAYWRALSTVTKSKVFWLVVIAIVFFIAMTGSEIKTLLGWMPKGA